MTEHTPKTPKTSPDPRQSKSIQEGLEQEIVPQIAQNARLNPQFMTPRNIIHLQRTIGNQAVMRLLDGQAAPRKNQNQDEQQAILTENGIGAAASVPEIHAAAPDHVQRTAATVKGKFFGKTSVRTSSGARVGKVDKGTSLDVDTSDTIQLDKDGKLIDYYHVKINSAEQAAALFSPIKSDGLLNNLQDSFADLYIETSAVTVSGAEQEAAADEDDGLEVEGELGPLGLEHSGGETSLSVPLFGHTLKVGTGGVEVSGEIERQELTAPLPEVNISIDIPLPVPAPVYVTAGLTITPSLGLGFEGDYSVSKSRDEEKVSLNMTVDGQASLAIDAKAGAGAGVANVAGLEAGFFAGAEAGAKVEGTLKGDVTKKADKSWKTSTLKLGLAAEASIVGKAGAYISAKILTLNATKKFTFKKIELAKFEYARPLIDITKDGVRLSDLVPKLSDFKMAINKTSDKSQALDAVDERTPLLSAVGSSDDD